MQVELSSELEKLVRDLLASGRYGSVEDVLSTALWILTARDRLAEERKAELTRKVLQAREQARS